jgi:RNA polymerase sigma factor (sigma-70 family)
MDWQAAGVVVAAVGVLLAFVIGVWQIVGARRRKANESQHQRVQATGSTVNQAGGNISIVNFQVPADLAERMIAIFETMATQQSAESTGQDDDASPKRDTPTDETARDAFEKEEQKYKLARAINQLPERDKIVITLYYYEGLTMAEIANVLGVSRSTIGRMHRQAVLTLREATGDEIAFPDPPT